MGNLRLKLRTVMGRKNRSLRLLIITGLLTVGYLYALSSHVFSVLPAELDVYSDLDINTFSQRRLLSTNDSDGVYPPPTFTLEQLQKGAVILHVIGLIYMFVALAIVCDEFFVPSLGVIVERLDISEDVAGATFMAAGGSAPELFTSIIGVFLAKNNVGIGTIVGSAVFNILFVIGMCALFSREVLTLTWWPLFRDVSFYSIDLIFLIVFFLDQKIEWWEALILFLCYIAYVVFMKFNHQIEKAVKGCLMRTSLNKVQSTDSLLNEKTERSCSLPILHAGAGRFRHGMLQLMIHTMDPIGNGDSKVDDKAMHMHAMETLQVLIDAHNKKDSINGIQNGAFSDRDNQIHMISNGQVSPDSNKSGGTRKSPSASQETSVTMLDSQEDVQENGRVTKRDVNVNMNNNKNDDIDSTSDSKSVTNIEEIEEPLDLSWPSTNRERLTYVLVAPIVFALWITLPDVRRQEKRKWYAFSFLGSIMWIGFFSYLMVWWANVTGRSIPLPDEVMGLTILAAGTSIPDLITSVIVAKKGFGDMAVSSSVGSNIFDITVGLPFPWLIYSAVNSGASKDVSSDGLLCSIILLFVMLVAVITTIALSKWKMSRILGLCMFFFYLVFITLSVLLELKKIPCVKI